MKIVFGFLLTFFLATSVDGLAQCDADAHASACIPKLSKGFIFLKSYAVDSEDGDRTRVEYSYVFSKGRQYQINLCTGKPDDADGMVINVYDGQRKPVGSSKQGGKYLTGIQFACRSTGIYYIQYVFENPALGCAGSALGFQ